MSPHLKDLVAAGLLALVAGAYSVWLRGQAPPVANEAATRTQIGPRASVHAPAHETSSGAPGGARLTQSTL